jgi:tripartite-type tricarboxylate transporter receptor subunit TctC
MLKFGVTAALCATAVVGGVARAQEYPTRPVTIVVAFAAGGPFENIRPLGVFLEKSLGRPFIIENRPGAGGLIGAEYVARAAPDGYTLLYGFAGLTAFKALLKDPRIDPLRDFAPISSYIELAGGFATNPQVPARTIEEFIAYARANPGKVNYGSLGRNTVYLQFEAFKRAAKIDLTEIQYSGTALATTGLLRNDVQVINTSFNKAFKGQVDANVIRPLLVATSKRLRLFPDIPTAAEKGYDLPRNNWSGLFAPANTPRPIIDRLAAEMARFAASAEAQKYAAEQDSELTSSTPEQLRSLVESQTKLWLDTAAAVGLQPQ